MHQFPLNKQKKEISEMINEMFKHLLQKPKAKALIASPNMSHD